jgi:hypothetical protein
MELIGNKADSIARWFAGPFAADQQPNCHGETPQTVENTLK